MKKMNFYQLPFIHSKIGAIIVLIIYLFYSSFNLNDDYYRTKGIPYPIHPKKIDVSRGEDIWFLTEEYDVMYFY